MQDAKPKIYNRETPKTQQSCLNKFTREGGRVGGNGIRIGISIGGYPPYFLHISCIFPPYKNMGGKTPHISPHISPYSPIF